MPTKFTRTAGTLAFVAAGLWFAALALYWVALGVADDWSTAAYLVWSAIILAAGVLTLLATIGLRQRHETSKLLAMVGLVILGVGVVSSIISWAIPLWMTIQGVGMLLVALAIWSESSVPRSALAAYGTGMLVGSIVFAVLTTMKMGTPDEYGDYPVAWVTGLTVGLSILAAGLLGVGGSFRNQPADGATSEQTPTQ